MNKIKLLFQIFLILVFLAGIYVVITFDKYNYSEGLTTQENIKCPDLLVRKGEQLLLYNTNKPVIDGVNPVRFNTLDDYKNFLEIQHKQGIHCPILFLQHEYDIQGKGIYRSHTSPTQMDGGINRFNKNENAINNILDNNNNNNNTPLFNPTNYKIEPSTQPPIYKDNEHGMPIPVIDANRENGNYNKGNYAGFDPTGLYVGKYTEIDKIHDSTKETNKSDNPMDSNWGGVLHTQKSVDSGKYEENNITKPILFQPKTLFTNGIPSPIPPPKDIIS